MDNGAHIVQERCHGEFRQAWLIDVDHLGSNTPTQIVSVASGKCVSVSDTKYEGYYILVQEDCDDDRGVQKWRITIEDSLNPYNVIIGLGEANDKCADVRGGKRTVGTRLILWRCNGVDNQSWGMYDRVWRHVDIDCLDCEREWPRAE